MEDRGNLLLHWPIYVASERRSERWERRRQLGRAFEGRGGERGGGEWKRERKRIIKRKRDRAGEDTIHTKYVQKVVRMLAIQKYIYGQPITKCAQHIVHRKRGNQIVVVAYA